MLGVGLGEGGTVLKVQQQPQQKAPAPTPSAVAAVAIAAAEAGHTKHESGLHFRAAEAKDAAAQLIDACKRGDLPAVQRLLGPPHSKQSQSQGQSQASGEKKGLGKRESNGWNVRLSGVPGVPPPGVHVNTRGMWDSTPLIVAAHYEHYPVALALLQYEGVDVRHRNEKGASALLHLCLNRGEGYLPVMEQILQMQAQAQAQRDRDRDGDRDRDRDRLACVVYNPATDASGPWSPLSAVCANGDLPAFELLRAADPAITAHCRVAPVPVTGVGASAGSSSGGGSSTGAETQVPWGVRKSAAVRGATPLMLACAYGHASVVSHLITLALASQKLKQKQNEGARATADDEEGPARDEHMASHWHHAARGSRPAAALAALFSAAAGGGGGGSAEGGGESGACAAAQLQLRDCWGYTALHYVCHTTASSSSGSAKRGEDEEEAAQLHLQAVASVVSCVEQHCGAMAAEGLVCLPTLAQCDKKGLSAESGSLVPYKAGTTPLHIAVSRRAHGVCALLLRHGADPQAKDETGTSALALAKRQARGQLTPLLQVLEQGQEQAAAAAAAAEKGVDVQQHKQDSGCRQLQVQELQDIGSDAEFDADADVLKGASALQLRLDSLDRTLVASSASVSAPAAVSVCTPEPVPVTVPHLHLQLQLQGQGGRGQGGSESGSGSEGALQLLDYHSDYAAFDSPSPSKADSPRPVEMA